MVVVLYALSAFIALLTSVITSALRAQQLSRHLFVSQVYATLVALPVGWVLIKYWGVEGAVLGMILTNVVVGVSNYIAYRKDLRVPASPRPAGAGDEGPGSLEPLLAAAPTREAEPEVSPTSAPAATLRTLFAALDEERIDYCVLHGYEDFSERVSSDVDCLIAAAALPRRLAAVLRKHEAQLGVRVVQWVEGSAHFVVLAGRKPGGGVPFFLQLHACTDYDLAQRTFYRGAEVLRGRRRHVGDAFWVPDPAVEFGAHLARRISKRELRDEHARRLETLYRLDPEGCRRQANRLWGVEAGGRVTDAAARDDWDPVRRDLGSLRAGQNRRALAGSPLRFAGNTLAGAARRLRRWWRADRGLSVVLLGPDGSGKSSVVERVRRDLCPAFVGTDRRTFPPGLLRRGGGGSNPAPHAQRQRSPLSSIARAVLYWFPYCALSQFTSIRAARVGGVLVLHDRHLVDALVDPRRYRYRGPAWLLRLIWRLVPKPDMVILLDAPAELVQARKQEVPPEETRRQLNVYRALVTGMHNGHTVNAAVPLDEVVASVEDVILEQLARRVARRFGTEAGR